MPRLHADELAVDLAQVRRMVDRSCPEHAGEALVALGESGSSNALFRLGRDKLVRIPRQPGGGATIEKEAAWLPVVAAHVSVAVPAVVGVGEPDEDYPERWSITTWIDGTRPAVSPRSASGRGAEGLAGGLARFLEELRAMPVPDAAAADPSLTWYRGLPLWQLDADLREAADACRALELDLDVDEALRVWDRAAEASRDSRPATTWFHGDLLVENLLVDDDGLAAVLDFGGLAIGDPTVDLVVAWEALDRDGRTALRRALDVDEPTWTVSRGWALLIAMITFPYYATTMPGRCADRLAMAHAAIRGT